MKKFAILLLALLLALPLAGCQKGQTDHSINVYNWGEYIDESIFDDFEAETGIHVNYKTFASNEMLYSAIKGGGNSYDVIIPSDYMVARMGEEGLLMELDYSKIPNAENIDERYLHPAYDTEQKYSLPYMWGTTGIIYNTTAGVRSFVINTHGCIHTGVQVGYC
ncbi:MAG: extracellular solute-binding protein [Clostridiales bacterium]|nr:extracellular solute-binding protein [Clostridiales bacterium]